jgi:hypothetical protein
MTVRQVTTMQREMKMTAVWDTAPRNLAEAAYAMDSGRW